jgi:GntR family transcriptional regulator, transcriptional repressor for pyruvate dehydrogenase complex
MVNHGAGVPNTVTLPRMTLGPVSRPSVPDQVFARLCDMIVSGHYADGDRLPTQRALAEDFGVNMASVREALKRLEQLRLVEVRHGDATRVLDWRRAGLEALALLGTVDSNIVKPLFEARRIILAQVACLAAERRTDEQVEHLAEMARRMAVADTDEEAQAIEWQFIAVLVSATDNLVFELMGNSVRELYKSHAQRFLPLVSDREELGPLFMAVVEAIKACDTNAADDAMTALTAAQEARMIEAV